jgi:hypothetical protein
METPPPRSDEEGFGEADLGEVESEFPDADDEMIEPDSDPLDTEVEDADLFLGDDDGEIP